MVAWTVTFERDGTDLTIGTDPDDTFYLSEQEATWPSFSVRREYAEDSKELNGRQIMGFTIDQGQQTLGIYVQAASMAALIAAKEELEAATSQLTYTFTNTLDGVSRAYEAHAELPQWGEQDSGMLARLMAKATIVIPLNPAVS